jgi:hypothetical protein
MASADQVKTHVNSDNRKAKANRNNTYDLPPLPVEENPDMSRQKRAAIRMQRLAESGLAVGLKHARPNGRASYAGPYTLEIADQVLEYRRQGLSIAKIARLPGMPAVNTVLEWRNDYPDFDDLWIEAFNAWLESTVEETIDLADSCYDGRRGSINPFVSAAVYNAIKARQWLISKRIADRYGERLDVNAETIILQPQEIPVTTGLQADHRTLPPLEDAK